VCFLTSNITSADFKTNFWDANTYVFTFVQEYDRTSVLIICTGKLTEEKIHQLIHKTLCVNGIFFIIKFNLHIKQRGVSGLSRRYNVHKFSSFSFIHSLLSYILLGHKNIINFYLAQCHNSYNVNETTHLKNSRRKYII
jgi:hypothetical protein